MKENIKKIEKKIAKEIKKEFKKEFKETNDTSFKKIKEGFKEYNNYLLLMFIIYVLGVVYYMTSIFMEILSLLILIILLIFSIICDIFIEIIKTIGNFLDITKTIFSENKDEFWSDILAELQKKGFIKVEENTEQEHEDEQESE